MKITRIVDGDSLEFRRGGFLRALFGGTTYRLRLYGIDAPELSQRFGKESLLALRKEIRGSMRLRVMNFDRYGRVVGLLYGSDPRRSVNRTMVKNGWAHWYRRYGGAEWGFEQAEFSARVGRLGVWSDQQTQRPWDYRAAQKAPKISLRAYFATAIFLAAVLGLLFVIIPVCSLVPS